MAKNSKVSGRTGSIPPYRDEQVISDNLGLCAYDDITTHLSLEIVSMEMRLLTQTIVDFLSFEKKNALLALCASLL
jgi:hypothetical protein